MLSQIDVEIKELGNKRFVTYQPCASEHCIATEREMLRNNEIKGILPLSTTQVNENIILQYDITGKMSLLRFIEGAILTRDELIKIISVICDALLEADVYMLEQDHFVLDMELIYLTAENREPQMMVVPIKTDSSDVTMFLFMKSLIDKIHYDSRDTSRFYEKLTQYIKTNELMTVKDLRDAIDHMTQKPKMEKENVSQQEEIFIQTPPIISNHSEPSFNIPNGPIIQESKSEKKDELSKQRMKELLFGKKKSKNKNKNNSVPSTPAGSIGFDIPGQRPQPINSSIKPVDNNETVLVDEADATPLSPYLIERSTNRKIPITLADFKLGRETSHVNYVITNPTVGRLHANIIVDQSVKKAYIRDDNSKNGTFINGTRIQSNVNVQLDDGVLIRLGKEEFIFKVR